MMNFAKAKKALEEIRTRHIGRAQNDPKMWDLALALEATIHELDSRLSRIERNQATISQQIERLPSAR